MLVMEMQNLLMFKTGLVVHETMYMESADIVFMTVKSRLFCASFVFTWFSGTSLSLSTELDALKHSERDEFPRFFTT